MPLMDDDSTPSTRAVQTMMPECTHPGPHGWRAMWNGCLRECLQVGATTVVQHSQAAVMKSTGQMHVLCSSTGVGACAAHNSMTQLRHGQPHTLVQHTCSLTYLLLLSSWLQGLEPDPMYAGCCSANDTESSWRTPLSCLSAAGDSSHCTSFLSRGLSFVSGLSWTTWLLIGLCLLPVVWLLCSRGPTIRCYHSVVRRSFRSAADFLTSIPRLHHRNPYKEVSLGHYQVS